MQRLESTLLNKSNGKWYYQDKPYDGIVFFEKEDHLLEVFEVEKGHIIRPYQSPCKYHLPSPIQINSTGFCCEDEDDYESETIPQYYQGEPYQGMSYTFMNGKCDAEIYTGEDATVDNKIYWDTKDFKASKFHLHYIANTLLYSYGNWSDSICFSYRDFKNDNKTEFITIDYHPVNKKVKNFEVTKDVLVHKSYLSSPVAVPEVFYMLENYQNFIFTRLVRLELDKSLITELFNAWVTNNSFKFIESLTISGLDGLDDLTVFCDTEAFACLKEVCIKKETSIKRVEELRNIAPHLDVEHLNF